MLVPRDLSDAKFSEEHDGILQNCPKPFVRKINGLKDVQNSVFWVCRNLIFVDQSLDPHLYHNNLVTFPFQEKSVTAVTELIHCNQPMSLSPHAFMLEVTDINKYPVPWSAWYLLHLFFGTFACLIFACAQISQGGSFPVISIFMYFAVGLSKWSRVRPVI